MTTRIAPGYRVSGPGGNGRIVRTMGPLLAVVAYDDGYMPTVEEIDDLGPERHPDDPVERHDRDTDRSWVAS